jgi:hypothetical protein
MFRLKQPGAVGQEGYGAVVDAAEVDFHFKLILSRKEVFVYF